VQFSEKRASKRCHMLWVMSINAAVLTTDLIALCLTVRLAIKEALNCISSQCSAADNKWDIGLVVPAVKSLVCFNFSNYLCQGGYVFFLCLFVCLSAGELSCRILMKFCYDWQQMVRFWWWRVFLVFSFVLVLVTVLAAFSF